MSAGRPRVSKELLELNGRMTNQTVYKDYTPSSGLVSTISKDTILKPPAKISAKSKKAWNAIVPNLIALQVLNEQDLPSLDKMINSFEEYVKATNAIKEFDKVFDPLDINQVKHRRALNQWMMDSINSFNRIAAHFGITPTERTKLTLAVEEKTDDPLSVVLGI